MNGGGRDAPLRFLPHSRCFVTPVQLERSFLIGPRHAMASGMARRLPTIRSAADFMPERKTLVTLREAAGGCRGFELYKRGAQTVVGGGGPKAKGMMIGEAPGPQEGPARHPLPGAAGKLPGPPLGPG